MRPKKVPRRSAPSVSSSFGTAGRKVGALVIAEVLYSRAGMSTGEMRDGQNLDEHK